MSSFNPRPLSTDRTYVESQTCTDSWSQLKQAEQRVGMRIDLYIDHLRANRGQRPSEKIAIPDACWGLMTMTSSMPFSADTANRTFVTFSVREMGYARFLKDGGTLPFVIPAYSYQGEFKASDPMYPSRSEIVNFIISNGHVFLEAYRGLIAGALAKALGFKPKDVTGSNPLWEVRAYQMSLF